MKFLGALLMMFGLTQCKSVKFEKTYPFTVKEATYTNWVGGQPGVRGTKVTIPVVNAENITFDKIYFNGKSTQVEIQKNGAARYAVGFFTTSKSNQDIIMHSDATQEMKNEVPSKEVFPFELAENEAVLSYKQNEKVKYIKLSNLQKTKSNFYQ